MNKNLNKTDKQLIQAFLSLNSETEVKNFLRDLLTTSEIKELSNRLEIARLLSETDLSYQEIAKKCQTSTTTVTRVNDFLNKKPHKGYKTVLKRLSR